MFPSSMGKATALHWDSQPSSGSGAAWFGNDVFTTSPWTHRPGDVAYGYSTEDFGFNGQTSINEEDDALVTRQDDALVTRQFP